MSVLQQILYFGKHVNILTKIILQTVCIMRHRESEYVASEQTRQDSLLKPLIMCEFLTFLKFM